MSKQTRHADAIDPIFQGDTDSLYYTKKPLLRLVEI